MNFWPGRAGKQREFSVPSHIHFRGSPELPRVGQPWFIRALRHKQNRTRFLVVEGDPNYAFFITRALRSFGNGEDFAICRNPSEAKDYLRGAGMYADRDLYPLPDVILTDLEMGCPSGKELVAWIRNSKPPLCELPIVALTGALNLKEPDGDQGGGVDQVFLKPMRFEELRTLLGALANQYCDRVRRESIACR